MHRVVVLMLCAATFVWRASFALAGVDVWSDRGVDGGLWQAGGVNTTVLSMLEQRAYGWFHFYAAAFPANASSKMVLSRVTSGTTTGLSK